MFFVLGFDKILTQKIAKAFNDFAIERRYIYANQSICKAIGNRILATDPQAFFDDFEIRYNDQDKMIPVHLDDRQVKAHLDLIINEYINELDDISIDDPEYYPLNDTINYCADLRCVFASWAHLD